MSEEEMEVEKKQTNKKTKQKESLLIHLLNQTQILWGNKAGSSYATQIVLLRKLHSGWGYLRSGAALGLEVRSYLEISKVPLLLILFEGVWRWKCCEKDLPWVPLGILYVSGVAVLQPCDQGIIFQLLGEG